MLATRGGKIWKNKMVTGRVLELMVSCSFVLQNWCTAGRFKLYFDPKNVNGQYRFIARLSAQTCSRNELYFGQPEFPMAHACKNTLYCMHMHVLHAPAHVSGKNWYPYILTDYIYRHFKSMRIRTGSIALLGCSLFCFSSFPPLVVPSNLFSCFLLRISASLFPALCQITLLPTLSGLSHIAHSYSVVPDLSSPNQRWSYNFMLCFLLPPQIQLQMSSCSQLYCFLFATTLPQLSINVDVVWFAIILRFLTVNVSCSQLHCFPHRHH